VDNLRRTAARGTAFSFASILVTRALGFLTSLLLARFLGPGDFGAWSILIGFHSVAFLAAGLGLPLIAPKLVAEPGEVRAATDAASGPDPGHAPIRAILAAAFGLGLLAGAAAWLLAPFLADAMFGAGADPGPVRGTALAITAVVWSNAAGALLQGRQQIRRLAAYNAGLAALNLALVLPAAERLGLTGALAALSISHLVFTVVAIASLPKGSRRPEWTPATRRVFARGLRLGLPLLVSTLLVPLVAWLARTWLGHQSGLDAVGRYQVAETLNQAILFVPLAMTTPLYPMVAAQAARNPAEASRWIAPFFGYVVLLTLPAALLVGWLAPLLVRLFGPGYGESWPVVYLLSGGYFLSSLGHLTGAVLTGHGWTGRGLALNLFWAVVLLAAALALVPRHGAVGLAVSFGIAYIAQTALLAVVLRRWLGLNLLPAPRLLVTWGALFALGWWVLPRVPAEWTPIVVLPALGVTLAAGASLWRRAVGQILAQLRPGA
jgi:O-antigen/teichoic acid export membrane protein